MSRLDRLLTLLVVGALALLAGCHRNKEAATPTGGVVPGAPRTVPIVFYMFEGPTEADRNLATNEDVMTAVTLANQVFAEAAVQFYVADVRRLPVKHFHRHDDVVTATWAEVAEDAIRAVPEMATAGFRPDDTTSLGEWMVETGARTPADVIPVFVSPFWGSNGTPSTSACASPYPHNDNDGKRAPPWTKDHSRMITCHPSGKTPGWRLAALAHELGHYLGGLNHTFDATNEWAATTAGDTVEDYWDLVYAPLAGGGIATFSDKAGAAKAKGHLKPLDEGARVVPGSPCVIEVRPTGGRGERLHFTLQDAPGALGGLAFVARRPGEKNAMNVMSYMFDTPTTTPCELRLSRSQIAIIHRKMASKRGGRHLLGSVKRPVWTPPTS